MKGKTPILKVEHSRDFCLAHIEIWSKGESTDPREWTDKKQPCVPYILFEKTDENVNCYMDERGFEWIINELKEQLKKDANFVERLAKEYAGIYEKVNLILKKENSLDYEEIVKFLKDYHSGWPIYEALYFLVGILPENGKDFRIAKDAIELTDKTGDKGDKVMRISLKMCFPGLGELSSLLLTEEIFSKKIPSKIELERRAKKYFYANDKLFVNKTREDIEKTFKIKLEKNENKDLKEFKGQVAYIGKVRGVVRKI